MSGLEERCQSLEKMLQHKEKEIYSIQRIGKALSSTLQLDELLNLIMQETTSLMDADRSTLFILDSERQEIWSKIAQKAGVKEIRQQLGKGISGYVAQTGETLNIPDAYQDERFDPSTDRKTGFRTRSILCMPVWEPHPQEKKREIIGVIQVLNKRDGAFAKEDETLLEALAGQVAISIANSQLYHRLEKKYKEIDLLYEFEQLLNSVYELPGMLAQILSKTVDHLQAGWVFALFPGGSRYLLAGANQQHQTFSESSPSISAELQDFVLHPSPTRLQQVWREIQENYRTQFDVDIQNISTLFAPIYVDDENQGVLIVLDVHLGHRQKFEDERKLIELIAQKITRAQELVNLRESLLQRERLSAIGQLMSTVVHDIRGPINNIYGFVDLMQDKTTSGDERIEFADIVRKEIQSIMSMITEVLDFAKGKSNILPRKTGVKNVVQRFRSNLEQMCHKNRVELTVNANNLQQLIYADEEKLNRVFYNITKNALEAMGEGGKFVFKVSENDNEVTFQFIDNGPGIPPDIQHRLFDSFVTSGKESGTGLGLAIVKKIIDEHRGRIDIESEEGKGATFRIKIPVYKK